MTSTRRGVLLGLLVAAVVAGAGYAVETTSARGSTSPALGPGVVTVTMDIVHSRFVPDRLRVRAGTVVRFEVANSDPIHHELVVGPPDVHAAHGRGTERLHPPVPGEVSVAPNGTAMTFYAFDEPGTVRFACHLPRHAEYGMVGEIEVVG